MGNNRTYLDHAASTPLDPEVLEAMLPFLTAEFGNPSSIHREGRRVRAALDDARDIIATTLGCEYSEITFTGSGTEADNLAIIGVMDAAQGDRDHLIVSEIEHHAILHAAHRAESHGFKVTILPVDSHGFVSTASLEEAITDRTALVSIMHANNEIGTIQDVARFAKIAHERGALFHADAVQTFGTLPMNVGGMGADLLTISAHKIYGPKGIGALYSRTGVKVSPIIVGGAQERERRAGTENVAGIIGFGRATTLAVSKRESEFERLSGLRDKFIDDLLTGVKGAVLNGPSDRRLPNNINVSIEGVDGSSLIMGLDRMGIAASSGAACSSGSIEPSHVLKAIGRTGDIAASGVRFSLGRSTRSEMLSYVVKSMVEIVDRNRT